MNWYLALTLIFLNLSICSGAFFITDLLKKHQARIVAKEITLEGSELKNCDVTMEQFKTKNK